LQEPHQNFNSELIHNNFAMKTLEQKTQDRILVLVQSQIIKKESKNERNRATTR